MPFLWGLVGVWVGRFDIINFLITKKTPVSYISTGQEIPEDLIVASKEYLLKKFMED